MNKEEFIKSLRKALSGLPSQDIEQRLDFYSEMIDDRMEEGLSEEAAVCQIGGIDELVAQIKADIPLGKLVKEKITPKKKLRAWEIVLIILGSPVWLSLLIAAAAVIFSLYVVLWSVVISLWAVFACLAACALAITAAGIGFAVGGHAISGAAMIGAGLVCAGLSIFAFFGCKLATKGAVLLTNKISIGIKNCFIKKERA